jgi:hypothetical protein
MGSGIVQAKMGSAQELGTPWPGFLSSPLAFTHNRFRPPRSEPEPGRGREHFAVCIHHPINELRRSGTGPSLRNAAQRIFPQPSCDIQPCAHHRCRVIMVEAVTVQKN